MFVGFRKGYKLDDDPMAIDNGSRVFNSPGRNIDYKAKPFQNGKPTISVGKTKLDRAISVTSESVITLHSPTIDEEFMIAEPFESGLENPYESIASSKSLTDAEIHPNPGELTVQALYAVPNKKQLNSSDIQNKSEEILDSSKL